MIWRYSSAEFRLINATKPTELLRTAELDSLPNMPLIRMLATREKLVSAQSAQSVQSSQSAQSTSPASSPDTYTSIHVDTSQNQGDVYAEQLGRSCEGVFRSLSHDCEQLLRTSRKV